MALMKAAVFVEKNRIVLEDKPIPDIGPLDALVRITTTTICGTDVHILRGEYPVARGLTVGHEPVGVIEKLGSQVQGFREGQRVIAGAITPSGHSYACLCGCASQDGAGTVHGFKAIGGWKFGNLIDGCQAEYVRVPDAMANLAPIPDRLSDEQVLMCPDIMLRPGGTLSSLGVYSADLSIPLGPFAAGLGDYRIVTTLCPGGKERMRRLMAVVASGRVGVHKDNPKATCSTP